MRSSGTFLLLLLVLCSTMAIMAQAETSKAQLIKATVYYNAADGSYSLKRDTEDLTNGAAIAHFLDTTYENVCIT